MNARPVVPKYAFGTWELGEASSSRIRDERAIRAALDVGVNTFFASERWMNGATESFLGDVLARVDRSSVRLGTMAWTDNATARNLREACERSLERLRTDYVDFYMPQHRNPSVALEETCAALDGLVRKGMVRSIGLSNFGLDSLREAVALLEAPVALVQYKYNLWSQHIARNGILEFCRENGIVVQAWRVHRYDEYVSTMVFESKRPSTFDVLAEKYDVTPACLSLNWVIRQVGVSAVVRTATPRHLIENLSALDFRMSDEDAELLADAFGGFAHPPEFALR